MAAYATQEENGLHLTGLVASISGGKQIHVTGHGADGWELGARLAKEALAQGAAEILAHA